MRCTVRIPLVPGRSETYCYEPLNERGECAKHGVQWLPRARSDELSDELLREQRGHDAEIERIAQSLGLRKDASVEEIVQAIRELRGPRGM